MSQGAKTNKGDDRAVEQHGQGQAGRPPLPCNRVREVARTEAKPWEGPFVKQVFLIYLDDPVHSICCAHFDQ